MISNFITPPDFVPTVVIIDASTEQVQACAAACKELDHPYNVYLYNHEMNDFEWLTKAVSLSEVVLQAEGSLVSVYNAKLFGPNQEIKQPQEFFVK